MYHCTLHTIRTIGRFDVTKCRVTKLAPAHDYILNFYSRIISLNILPKLVTCLLLIVVNLTALLLLQSTKNRTFMMMTMITYRWFACLSWRCDTWEDFAPDHIKYLKWRQRFHAMHRCFSDDDGRFPFDRYCDDKAPLDLHLFSLRRPPKLCLRRFGGWAKSCWSDFPRKAQSLSVSSQFRRLQQFCMLSLPESDLAGPVDNPTEDLLYYECKC